MIGSLAKGIEVNQKMGLEHVRKLMYWHFKTDCAVCNIKDKCASLKEKKVLVCETANTYYRIMQELEGMEKLWGEASNRLSFLEGVVGGLIAARKQSDTGIQEVLPTGDARVVHGTYELSATQKG